MEMSANEHTCKPAFALRVCAPAFPLLPGATGSASLDLDLPPDVPFGGIM